MKNHASGCVTMKDVKDVAKILSFFWCGKGNCRRGLTFKV